MSNPTEWRPKTKQHQRSTVSRILPGVTLGLIFVAGAGFTCSYLAQRDTPSVQAESAAAVTAGGNITAPNFPSVSLAAQSAMVVDLTSGKTLYALNPNIQWPLASLTKIALVLAVIDALPSDTLIQTPQYTAPPSGGTERLPPDQTWTLQNAIDFTLAVSSNDGADLLAQAANDAIHQDYPQSPATGATLWRMNMLAQELGLTETYFLNDNGLDISTTQSGAYGSARDIATLFAYAATNDQQVFAATTEQTFTIESVDGDEATAVNTDEALPSIPGIIMGKTGYTDLAGGNLAVVFQLDGHRIVAVVLGSTEDGRFTDMESLVSATAQALSATK